jgi:predicted hydrolase (HD superfamily)
MATDSELHRAIGRVEGKLDMLLSHASKNDERISAVEKDISAVKSLSGLIAAGAAACVTVVAALADPVIKWFKGA